MNKGGDGGGVYHCLRRRPISTVPRLPMVALISVEACTV